MRWLLAAVAVTLSACSSPAPANLQPPQGFPNLDSFAAVDPEKYAVGGTAFVTAQQTSCVLDFGPDGVTVCSGTIPGFPANIFGDGCAAVRKPDQSVADAAYGFQRSDRPCGSVRSMNMTPAHKLTGDNGTCAVGDNGFAACIDADNRHGFVLKPEGSWTF